MQAQHRNFGAASRNPPGESGSARFWDRHAEGYAKRPISNEAAYQRKLAITREYLRPDMNLLEFGCGTGSTALVHAPHVRHIQAIDVSAKMLEIARGKADAGNITNVTFQQASIESYDAPDASYDMVLGLSILHLLADMDAAIAKVHRMLKPGGLFVSSTACLGDRMAYFKLIAPVGRWVGLMPLLRIFTVRQLEEALQRGGFEIEQKWAPEKAISIFIAARKPA